MKYFMEEQLWLAPWHSLSDRSPIIALSSLVIKSVMLLVNFAEIVGFAKVVGCIFLSYYMVMSKLRNGFLEIVAWICQN